MDDQNDNIVVHDAKCKMKEIFKEINEIKKSGRVFRHLPTFLSSWEEGTHLPHASVKWISLALIWSGSRIVSDMAISGLTESYLNVGSGSP